MTQIERPSALNELKKIVSDCETSAAQQLVDPMITPANIFDYRDRQVNTPKGYLTFRLYPSGWLVRYTPFEGVTEKVEDVDVWSACRFANDRSGK